MKKLLITILTLLSVTAVAIYAGCSPVEGETLTMETYKTAYEKITTAKKITEEITLKQGERTPYEYTKEYVADGENYTVTETTTTYNKIVTGEEELKTVEVKEAYSVARSAGAVATLNLNEELFKSVSVSATEMSAKIAEGKLGEVFEISSELEAPVSEAELGLKLTAADLTEITLNYTSQTYNVFITISFVYA